VSSVTNSSISYSINCLKGIYLIWCSYFLALIIFSSIINSFDYIPRTVRTNLLLPEISSTYLPIIDSFHNQCQCPYSSSTLFTPLCQLQSVSQIVDTSEREMHMKDLIQWRRVILLFLLLLTLISFSRVCVCFFLWVWMRQKNIIKKKYSTKLIIIAILSLIIYSFFAHIFLLHMHISHFLSSFPRSPSLLRCTIIMIIATKYWSFKNTDPTNKKKCHWFYFHR